MKISTLPFALAFLAVTFAASSVFAGTEKLSPELRRTGMSGSIDVIIRYQDTPSAAAHQKLAARGATLRHDLSVIHARHYSIPAGVLQDLANDPEVAYVTPDRHVGASLDQADVTIGANLAASYNVNGAGVGVAVIDSGLGWHPDISPRFAYEEMFINASTDDVFGHGTHVAGIIAGSGLMSTGSLYYRTFKGVAPGVSLVDLHVLDQNGDGTDSAVIAALQQAIALKSKYNIRVINLSLGRPVYESYKLDPLCQAVEQAWNAGIVVVVAAGNYGRTNPTTTDGYGTITAPGNDPLVITVGAMKDMGTPNINDDQIASYSSKGPTSYDFVAKPDLVAPGNLIDSLRAPASNLYDQYPQVEIANNLYMNDNVNGYSPEYAQMSGTSMATPFVTGTAALMIQQHPTMTPNQIKARLMLTADKTTFPATSSYTDPTTGIAYKATYDIFTIGAGYLNIGNALFSTVLAPASLSAASPTLVKTNSNTWTFDTATNAVWGSTAVWGSNAVWGSTAVWGSNAVWGSTAIWGSTAVWGSSVTSSSTIAESANTVLLDGDVY